MPSLVLQQPRWLTVKQVARVLDLHEVTVRRKIAAGEIHALQLGGPGTAVRVLENELQRFIHNPRRTHA
jgi:excisionase family DNA binding protein